MDGVCIADRAVRARGVVGADGVARRRRRRAGVPRGARRDAQAGLAGARAIERMLTAVAPGDVAESWDGGTHQVAIARAVDGVARGHAQPGGLERIEAAAQLALGASSVVATPGAAHTHEVLAVARHGVVDAHTARRTGVVPHLAVGSGADLAERGVARRGTRRDAVARRFARIGAARAVRAVVIDRVARRTHGLARGRGRVEGLGDDGDDRAEAVRGRPGAQRVRRIEQTRRAVVVRITELRRVGDHDRRHVLVPERRVV